MFFGFGLGMGLTGSGEVMDSVERSWSILLLRPRSTQRLTRMSVTNYQSVARRLWSEECNVRLVDLTENSMDNQMQKLEVEHLEEISDLDRIEIARLVTQGFTSGILDDGHGYRISWELKTDKFKN